ncbi:MAG: glycerol-3-phosphate acyltransferase [Clostridia bacterium]|nr:glycerol-3-phosphate acyltransferase [Clostridia bacterium]
MEITFWGKWYWFVLIALAGYLVGSLNFAFLISKLFKKDITKMGSGNPGTMNMVREFGPVIGFTTFFLDAFKGGLPALGVYFLFRDLYFVGGGYSVGRLAEFLCGLFAVLGHIFPITLNFKGGKGIATGIGFFWLTLGGHNPWLFLWGALVVLSVPLAVSLVKRSSICSLCYLTGFAIWQIVVLKTAYPTGGVYLASSILLIFVTVLVAWVAHAKNLRNLLAGEEHETRVFKKKSKKS